MLFSLSDQNSTRASDRLCQWQRGAQRSPVKVNWLIVNQAFPDFSWLSGIVRRGEDNHGDLPMILNTFKEKYTRLVPI